MDIENQNLESQELEEKQEDLEESETELSNVGFNWFALRVLRNEDKCVAQIKEHITLRKLQDKIVDVKYFKEYAILETEEYDPHSEFLPKKGFKSTPKSVWVRLPNGNFKRLRLLEKKPLSGMVFIKMQFDLDLFKMIRSWDAGYSFLGSPSPIPMSDAQLEKTASSLNDVVPDLQEYAKEKGYQVVEGPKTHNFYKEIPIPPANKEEEKSAEETQEKAPETTKVKEVKKPHVVESGPEPEKKVRKLSPEEEKEAQKARIYSELNIKENLKTFSKEPTKDKPKPAAKKGSAFNVNDFVFIKHLGFKGVIQEINYEENKVVVGVQMFGRRQPVECKISDIQLI